MLKGTFFTIITFCLFSIPSNLIAQTSAFKFADSDFSTKGIVNIQMDKDDLTTAIFFTDEVNQLLFIDFEALGEDVSELKILNDETVVLKEDVSRLPENTIYEINLKNLKSGKNYKILLNTPFGILTKEFFIQKS
jgi:hypothetical protein